MIAAAHPAWAELQEQTYLLPFFTVIFPLPVECVFECVPVVVMRSMSFFCMPDASNLPDASDFAVAGPLLL
jgi:hypothetical protein